MNKRTFIDLIIPKSMILITLGLLIFYDLISINFNFHISINEYITGFYTKLNTFLIQVPIIIILIVSSYAKFYNDMIIVRFVLEIKIFKAEIAIACFISVIYVFLLVLLEMIFIILTSGIPNQSFTFNCKRLIMGCLAVYPSE